MHEFRSFRAGGNGYYTRAHMRKRALVMMQKGKKRRDFTNPGPTDANTDRDPPG